MLCMMVTACALQSDSQGRKLHCPPWRNLIPFVDLHAMRLSLIHQQNLLTLARFLTNTLRTHACGLGPNISKPGGGRKPVSNVYRL